MTLLWPIHLSSVALSGPNASVLEGPEFGVELAQIGAAGFQRYLSTILPSELAADQELAAEFAQADHSRVNVAFERWQRRAFADSSGMALEELASWGQAARRLPGVNYSWPELHGSRVFQRLKARIAELSKLYLKRSGYQDVPKTFQIYIWAEVYNRGDALRPGARTTGAYLTGRFWASAQKGTLKLNFEDPRGINPPYGKTYSHAVYEGNLVLFPVWVSHFITPNMQDYAAVCYSFLVYPPGGGTLAWQDDLSAQLTVSKPLGQAAAKPPQGAKTHTA